MAKDDTRQFSLDDLQARRAAGKGQTRADAPAQAIDPDFWNAARVVMPTGKASVHLRLDTDVLNWFRSQGKFHLSRMNAVLRSYMDSHTRPR